MRPRAADPASMLKTVRARARGILLVREAAALLSIALAGITFAAWADYILRWPMALRVALWVVGLGILGWVARRSLLPAWRFRPGLTEVALRLERSEPGRRAGLQGLLASGLEFESSKVDSIEGALANRVADRAAQAVSTVRASAILRPAPAWRSAGIALLVLSVVASIALLDPVHARIGALRVITPWSAAQWPKREPIADATRIDIHPLGAPVPLRAALLRDQPGALLAARCRLIRDGRAGPVTRLPLSDQERLTPVRVGDGDTVGRLFERLVDPAAMTPDAADPADQAADQAVDQGAELEYWIESGDDRTSPRRIRLVPPPRVVAASARIDPPAYVGAAAPTPVRDLGPGNDERAIVGGVLAGSHVRLDIALNKPVPAPPEGWIDSLVPGGLGPDASVSAAGERWTISWTLRESARLSFIPVDEHGLGAVDPAVYAFDASPDAAPSVVVTDPARDESLLPTAELDAAGEARDDVALEWVALQTQVARPEPGSIGSPPTPRGDPADLAREPAREEAGTGVASIAAHVRLSDFALVSGDELWITALATDLYAGEDGERREPTRSAVRRIRIIDEAALVEQIQGELTALRQAAIRLDAEQARLAESLARSGVSPELVRAQTALTERLAGERGAIDQIASRVERNRLDDPALSGLLADARELLDQAGDRSNQASGAMAPGLESDLPEGLSPRQRADADEAQRGVRDDLGRLIEMLDRGQDGWLVRRELERLASEQRELQARTRSAARDTTGKDASQLTPAQRQTLDQIVQRQAELAERAEDVLNELSERAAQLKDKDAVQSAGMSQAAQRGREQQVPSTMQQAARSAGQNQMGPAQQQQQQAAEALEEMIEDLQRAQERRDEALRRELLSLIDSIRGLVSHQEGELARLDAAVAGPDAAVEPPLDQAMIRLHQNTLGVEQQARSGFREIETVAALLGQAASAQSGAIVSLRAEPADAPAARESEAAALARLREALAEAERQEREAAQRDRERQKQELKKRYREALELQVALEAETAPFAGREPDRRDRMAIRGLGGRQQTLRETLADIESKTEGLGEVEMFAFAHRRLDREAQAAADPLRAGHADAGVTRAQRTVIRLLQSIVESLDDPQQQDEFREEQGQQEGGGGGGGQGGEEPLVPPLAELRLLRAIQQEIADRTRELDAGPGSPEAAGELEELGSLQRDLAGHAESLIEKVAPPAPPGVAPGGTP